MPVEPKAPMRAIRAFFTEELWPSSRPGHRASLKDWKQFFVVVSRGFVQNRCWVRAAALSYTSILALVPLLALVLGISTAMLKTKEDAVFDSLMKGLSNVVPQISQTPAEEQEKMRTTFKGMLGEVDAGTLGLIGSLMLIVTSVSLFSTIEHTLNDIWGVQRGRSPAMKVVFYWTTLTLGSILIFIAIGLTSTLKMPAVMGFLENHGVLKVLGHFLPYLVMWTGFFLLYQLMPNTQVDPRAALLGGIAAGTLWQLNHTFNVVYVSKVMAASKLYGSLGIVPIFLFGLYISWLIVVLGAQVAYTFQNAKVLALEQQEATDNPNQASKEMVALRVMLVIARQFLRGDPPISTTEISTQIGVPLHLVNQTIESLCNARLLVEIAGDSATFEPARPIEKITAHDVFRAMRELQGEPQETTKDEDDALLRGIVDRVSTCAEGTARGFDFRRLAEGKDNLT